MTEIIILKTIEYLNQTAGTNYSHNQPETIKNLNRLIELGFGINDFKLVINKKWKHWKGTKYQPYVRPATLFGKNFETYLNEQRTTESRLSKVFKSVDKAKQHNWVMGTKRR
jgi:uncharacterized phage protein (TIGR02220 family)